MALHRWYLSHGTFTAQVARYASVGALCAATDLTLYSLLTYGFGIHPVHANLVSRPIGGIMSFTLNKLWTFKNRDLRRTHHQFLRFALIWFLAFSASEALIAVYHGKLGLGPFPAKLGAEATIGLLSFLCQRFWIFRTSASS